MSNKSFIAILCILVPFLVICIIFVSFVSNIVFSSGNYYNNSCALVWEHIRNDEEFIEEYGTPINYISYHEDDRFKHSLSDKTMTIIFKVSTDKDRQYLVTALLDYPENEIESLEVTVISVE